LEIFGIIHKELIYIYLILWFFLSFLGKWYRHITHIGKPEYEAIEAVQQFDTISAAIPSSPKQQNGK